MLSLYSIYRQLSIGRPQFIIKLCKRGGEGMISYAPFYETLKEKNVSTYKLIHQYGVSRSLLDRLRHDKPISTVTIHDLCRILDCRVQDILEYIPE